MAVDAAGALSPGHLAERPLLPRGAPAVCGEPPEELDAKYARRYPYGVICRGLLVPAEAPRLTLVAVVLLLLCSTTSWAACACSPPRGGVALIRRRWAAAWCDDILPHQMQKSM